MILLFFSLLGILLSGILVTFNIRKNSSAVYLGSFFFLVSLYAFIQYSILYSESVTLTAVAFVNIGFPTYLIGPMLYFYVRSVISDRSGLKLSDSWHFFPMFVFFAGSIPYMLTPWSFKTETAMKLIEDSIKIVPLFRDLFGFKIANMLIIYISRPILVLVYIIWSAVLLKVFLKNRKERSVLPGQRFVVKWLVVLLVSVFVLTICQSLLIFQTYAYRSIIVFYTLNIFQILSALGITGLMISPFFFPSILYGLPRVPQKSAEKVKEDQNTADTEIKEPGFAKDYLELIAGKVEEVMDGQKPYLQPDLNLNSFSKIVNIPAHHLAYYFREVRKEAFNDYRNCNRVLHAKELILDGKATEMTLEGIGLSSGFSSRTTFFRAFKKCENISPGEFLAQNNGKTS